MRKRPPIAYTNVFLAVSSCLASPLERIIRIPERIMIIAAIVPANIKRASITYEKSTGRHLKESTVWSAPFKQPFICAQFMNQ